MHTTAVDDLLAKAGRVNDPSRERFTSGLATVERAVSDSRCAASPARPGPRPKLRRLITVSVAAALTLAAIIVIPLVAGHGAGVNAEAASVLQQAGQAAGSQRGGWPRAAYWHVSTTYRLDGRTYHRDIWQAHHGDGVLHDTGLPGRDPGFITIGPSTYSLGSNQLTWDQLYALPTDAHTLLTKLRSTTTGFGITSDAELFVVVGDLLRESPAPPTLRKALYDAAADIPGVQVVGDSVDSLGRRGTAVVRDGKRLLVDTTNGRLLAEGEGSDAVTYVHQGPVASVPPLTR